MTLAFNRENTAHLVFFLFSLPVKFRNLPPGGSLEGSSSCSSSGTGSLLSSMALNSVQNMSYSSWSNPWPPRPFIRNAISLSVCWSFHSDPKSQELKNKWKRFLTRYTVFMFGTLASVCLKEGVQCIAQ